MDIPKNEDMPWLTEETEEEKDLLKVKWVINNKDMIPLEDLKLGQSYKIVYVYDSGVNKELAASFRKVHPNLKPLDVLIFSVTLEDISYYGSYYMSIYNGEQLICRVGCAPFNYGKSWRLKRIN